MLIARNGEVPRVHLTWATILGSRLAQLADLRVLVFC